MKKNIYLASLLTGFMAFTAISCDNPGEPHFDNDEFTSTLYLKNSGQVNVEFYNVNEDITYITGIGKGGTNAEITRNASLDVFTQEEMDAYNQENASDFVILPQECYEFERAYTLEGKTESVPVNISLKAGIGLLDQSKQYVLPLKLTSDNYSVNEDKERTILIMNVITPKVSLGAIGKLDPVNFSVHDNSVTTAQCPITLNLDAANTKWQFSVVCETDEEVLESKVEEFVSGNGGEYTLLPATNYTIPAIEFNAESNKVFNIDIDRTGLTAGDYLLPVILKSVSGMPFDIASDEVCFVHVSVNNQITLSADDLYVNSSDNANQIPLLVNGIRDENGWQSQWWNGSIPQPICDPKYGIYIDINNIDKIKETVRLLLSIKTTHNNLKHVQIYAGNSEDDLQLIHENENCYPDTGSSRTYDTGNLQTGEFSMIRIACIKNCKNDDMRTLQFYSGTYVKNVHLSEIELYGN